MTRRVVVIGANACGASVVGSLREEGFDGDILLVGEEPLPPYERPPLSKEYLRGDQDLEKAYLRPDDWYSEQAIDACFGVRVRSIDVGSKTVRLEDGEFLGYDSLVLATGIRNRTLEIPGSDLDGIHYLRTAADAARIREEAAEAVRIAVVGMGFIGAEVAASLREMGRDVTVVEPFETALFRVLGADFGRVVENVHRDHGVAMRFGEGVDSFDGDSRVRAVVTSTGESIDCDLVVVGVGTLPNDELAREAGIVCDNGVLVDATLRTSAPEVFAGGDVANHDHPLFGRMRVEHFDNALKMGATIARNIQGAGEVFDDPHWFWSDQFDLSIQMAGHAPEHDEIVVRGSVGEASFSAFYMKGGAVLQVLGINRPRDVRRSMALIRGGAAVDPGRLRDEGVDLRTLASSD